MTEELTDAQKDQSVLTLVGSILAMSESVDDKRLKKIADHAWSIVQGDAALLKSILIGAAQKKQEPAPLLPPHMPVPQNSVTQQADAVRQTLEILKKVISDDARTSAGTASSDQSTDDDAGG